MGGTTTMVVETIGMLLLVLFEEAETMMVRAFVFQMQLGMQLLGLAPTALAVSLDGALLATGVATRRRLALLVEIHPRATRQSRSMLTNGRRSKYDLIGTGTWVSKRAALSKTRNTTR